MMKDLTREHPDKILWRFLLPMLVSVMFQQIYNIADSCIAGRFAGEDALAAVGASYPITVIFMAFAVVLNIVKDVKLCFGGFDADTVSPSVASIYDDVPEEVLAKATAALKEAEDNDEDGTNSKGGAK